MHTAAQWPNRRVRCCTVAGASQVANHPRDAAAATRAGSDGLLLAAALCTGACGATQHEHQWYSSGGPQSTSTRRIKISRSYLH